MEVAELVASPAGQSLIMVVRRGHAPLACVEATVCRAQAIVWAFNGLIDLELQWNQLVVKVSDLSFLQLNGPNKSLFRTLKSMIHDLIESMVQSRPSEQAVCGRGLCRFILELCIHALMVSSKLAAAKERSSRLFESVLSFHLKWLAISFKELVSNKYLINHLLYTLRHDIC